MTLICIFF